MVKYKPTNAGVAEDRGLIPGFRRLLGGGNGSGILAWEIPWTEVAGEVQSTGLRRVRHVLANEHATRTLLCNNYHKWGGWLSVETKWTCTLTLDFPAFRNEKNRFVLFKSPSLCFSKANRLIEREFDFSLWEKGVLDMKRKQKTLELILLC